MPRDFKFWTASLLFLTLSQRSYGETEESDFRERCRSALAGQLLTKNDELLQTAQLRQLSEAKLAALQSELKKAAPKEPVSEKFEVANEERKLARLQRREAIESDLKATIAENDRHQASLKALDREVAKQVQALETLFRLKKVNLDGSGLYSYQLTFRQECPPYQTVCTLSTTQRRQLEKILQVMGDNLDCEKYLNLGRIDLNPTKKSPQK